MTISIPLKRLHHIQHLPLFQIDPQGEPTLFLETFTGWVQCNLQGPEELAHEEVKFFLPDRKIPAEEGGGFDVRRWPDGESGPQDWMINGTAMVAPSAFDLPENQTITAVDGATVALEGQSIGGVGGAPRFLVLTVKTGNQRGRLLSFTYQVNVLSWASTPVEVPLGFDGDAKPDL
ncbi:hypothetical protein [Streptomyces sp. NPDC055006]